MEPPPNQRLYDPEASIVLVGCRGAGKRSLGFIGALHLRRRLLIEEHCFEQITGLSRATFLQKHGKDAFALQNADVFKQMLDRNRRGCVIVCGMSSLAPEAQSLLAAYTATNPVVYVHREREQTAMFLDRADAQQLLEADQSHRLCSSYEYFNLFDSTGTASDSSRSSSTARPGSSSPSHSPQWDSLSASSSTLLHAKEDFANFLDLLRGQSWVRQMLDSPFSIRTVPPQYRQYSYALRLRLSFLLHMTLEWGDMEASGDCVELIIDCWPEDLLNIIAKQVALIRRKLRCPVIFHPEENPRNQPRRPADEKDRIDADLLALGLRLNVDYISLDLQRSWAAIVEPVLRHKGRTKLLGNFWCLGLSALPWEDPKHIENYRWAQALGCDVVRMVRFCSGDSPRERLDEFLKRLRATVAEPRPPLVAYDYSVLGVSTPFQCTIFIPVKHPGMGNVDPIATVCYYPETLKSLFVQGLLDPLQFYTLGASVSYSISPALHHAAYELLEMPHRFQAVDCSTLAELSRLSVADDFGGASLAAPFKVAIMPTLKLKSHHAAVIGAVNVLLPLRGQTGSILDHATSRNKAGPVSDFFGDNTDWSAILTCLKRAISPRNHVRPSKTTALIVGAGGMARAAIYALMQLGCRNIFIYNRTVQNAAAVASHFNEVSQKSAGANGTAPARICRVLPSMADPWPSPFEPPTLVISCVPATSVDGNPAADFEVPQQWLGSTTGGVAIELAYEPLITPLVAQMQTLRDTVSPAWVVVDGLEVVSEMAIEAFELMTGRMAPRRLMKSVCRKTWEEQRRERFSAW